MKTLVLGVGNEIMGDDGIGLYVVEELKGTIEGVDWDVTSESGLKLIDYLMDYDRVIIVDAIVSEEEVGKVSVFSLGDFCCLPSISNHSLDLISALRMINREIVNIPVEIFFIGICINTTGKVQSGLSKQMEDIFPEVVESVREKIEELISEDNYFFKVVGGDIHGEAKA